jgi:hypothetical protein
VHIFHVIPHAGLSVGGPYTIPMLISKGMVGYRPTTTIIDLCRFTGPHKSGMQSVHNQMLIQGSTTNGPQSIEVEATTLELEYPHTTPHCSYPIILPFPLVTPPHLKFKSTSFHSFHSLSYFNHFNSIRGIKGPTREWNQPLVFYR